ncbi:MAG: PAS domain-containing protein, partial [Pseudomonadota bacterium]
MLEKLLRLNAELESRVAERTVRNQEINRMLYTVLDTIPVRIFWKNRNLVYLGCNQLFAQDAGKPSPREVIGLTDHDLGWRELADRYRQDDAQVIESRRPKLAFEEPMIGPNGSTINEVLDLARIESGKFAVS